MLSHYINALYKLWAEQINVDQIVTHLDQLKIQSWTKFALMIKTFGYTYLIETKLPYKTVLLTSMERWGHIDAGWRWRPQIGARLEGGSI